MISWRNVDVKISDLKPWDKNPRKIDKKSAERMVQGWQEFGQVEQIAIGPDFELYNGHQRIRVLESAYGPDFQLSARQSSVALTEDQRKTLVLLLHKAAVGEFDWERMPMVYNAEDLLSVGFDRNELSKYYDFSQLGTKDAGADVGQSEELKIKWQTELGQIWALGPHRLMIGSSTDARAVESLLDGVAPAMMITDPPYGVDYDPNWRADAAEAGKLAYAPTRVGKVENDGIVDWRDAWALFPGDIVYVWHAGRFAAQVASGIEASGFDIRNQIIWAKSNFPISRGHYHWRHEPCWYAVRKGGKANWVGDRRQTTLWEINLDKNVEGGHGTQKPLECFERPMRNHGVDTIYDPFVGSGTAFIAAERAGYRGFGMEIDPGYGAVCLERYLKTTGTEPVLIEKIDLDQGIYFK